MADHNQPVEQSFARAKQQYADYAVDVEEEATAAEALAALQNVGGEDRAAAAVDPVYAGRLGSVYAFAGRGAEATPTLSAIPS